MVVFNNGTVNGLKARILVGGQTIPISRVGLNLLWKYLQKKEKKNITSETINKIMPHRIPSSTTELWCPWRLASRLTSRHHCIATSNSAITLSLKGIVEPKYKLKIVLIVIKPAAKDPNKGQGLRSTKWKE